jgi:flagellar motor switch protein FliM
MPTLELVNERFARYLRIGLFNYMHRSAEISVGTIRVQKYSEFIRNLVVPTNLNLVAARPLRGTALFVFDPSLVFLVVDNMFGGDGRFHTRVEGRDFTADRTAHHPGLAGGRLSASTPVRGNRSMTSRSSTSARR